VFGAILFMALALTPLVGVAVAKAGKPSLDLCAALPGFETNGDSFDIHTEGPTVENTKFDETATLQASSCGSYLRVPKGEYTLTQTSTPTNWHLAQVSCFAAGTSDELLADFDEASSSAKLQVKVPTVCIFSELPGGTGGKSSGSSNPGTTTTNPHTTTTTKPGTTTTSGDTSAGGTRGTKYCKTHPNDLRCRRLTTTTSARPSGGTVTTLTQTPPTVAAPPP
jgi:hypothetical protein